MGGLCSMDVKDEKYLKIAGSIKGTITWET